SFSFDLAQARAAAYMALGNIPQATLFEEQAVKLDPDAPDAWVHLARLYQRGGRLADQQLAERRASALQNAPGQQ
ncbi:MAG: tetratricopeptide repeat protein, partial [Candidatus Korobacteraceae bacterium]